MPLLKIILALFSRSLFAAGIVIISSCSSNPYTVLFNDNVVYSPNASTNDSLLSDANLQGCLNSVFISTGDSDPNNITLLACPDSGISTLNGIEALPNLEQLDLSFNVITDLRPLTNLTKLRLLSIGSNNIRNINPLLTLPLLRFISLQGNNNISCRQLDSLAEKIGNSLTRPQVCL